MTALDQQSRPNVIDRLKEHLGLITRFLDTQTQVVLRKPDVKIVDVREDERGHTVLVGQYSIGGVREFTRSDYLPDGDDGTSMVYQARVLEQLAREHAAVRKAIVELEGTQTLLDSPPTPAG